MRPVVIATRVVACLAVSVLVSCSTASPGAVDFGNGVSAWSYYSDDPSVPAGDVWSVEDGVLKCRGTPLGYIYTRDDYTDFALTLRWRWPVGSEPGKGGVLFRMTGEHRVWPRSLEAQINAGGAGDFWGLQGYELSGPEDKMKRIPHEQFGMLTNVPKAIAAERAPGEWNDYEIVADGGTVTLKINGQLVNEATGCDIVPGKICLTAEGTAIEFSNLVLVPKPATDS